MAKTMTDGEFIAFVWDHRRWLGMTTEELQDATDRLAALTPEQKQLAQDLIERWRTEGRDTPARDYPHRCDVCGVPMDKEGVCQECAE